MALSTYAVKRGVTVNTSEIINEVDSALHSNPGKGAGIGKPSKTRQPAIKSGPFGLAAVMRLLGVVAVALATTNFMFQGINQVNFMERHWIFFGLAALLGGIGLILGLKVRETKGARTFLGLSIAAIPVLFSQLGGMIHTQFGLAPQSMPAIFIAQPESPFLIALTTVITLLIMTPMMLLGFRTLARSQFSVLSIVFLIANMSLLIPSRHPGIIGGVIFTICAAIIWADTCYFRKETSLKNLEGWFCRCVLYIPVLILTLRNMFFAVNELWIAMLCASFGLLLFAGSRESHENATWKQLINLAGVLFMVGGWLLASVVYWPETPLPHYLIRYITGLSSGALIAILAGCVKNHSLAGMYRHIAALIALGTIGLQHLGKMSPIISASAIVAGGAFIAIGWQKSEKGVTIMGGLSALIGAAWFCIQAVTITKDYAWLFLAIIGIVVIVGASIIDVKKNALNGVMNAWRVRFSKDRTPKQLKAAV